MRIRSLALKLVVALAALAILWTALGYWVVPWVVKSQATALVRERMQRDLQLGEVHFKPWQLQLSINDLKLPDRDGSTLLALRHVAVHVAGWRSLRLRGAHLARVDIDGLQASTVIDKQGRVNLADLALLAGPDDGDTSPARFALDRLLVSDSALALRDESPTRPFSLQLKPIRFELRDFSTVDAQGNRFHFTARSAAGEGFDWQGKLELDPLRSTGQLAVTGLKHSTLDSYLHDALPFVLSSGTFDVQASYVLQAGEGPLQLQATVQQLRLGQVGLRAKDGDKDLVQWDALTVANARADLAKRSVDVEQVTLAGGRIDAALQADGRLNLQALAGPPTATVNTPAPTKTATPAEAPWRAALGELRVEGLSVSLQDQRVQPIAAVQVSNATLSVKGITSALDQPLQLDLAMQVGKDGKLALQGEALAQAPSFKGQLQLTQIDLTVAQPYLRPLAGLVLGSGWVDARLDLQHSPRQPLLVQGQVDVHDVQTTDVALNEPLLNWGRLRLNGLRFSAAPQQLRIKEVIATGLFARVVVGGDRTLNVSHVIDPQGTQAAAEAAAAKQAETERLKAAAAAQRKRLAAVRRAPASKASASTTATLPAATPPPFDVAIDVVRIEKGASNFTDLWIKPRFTVSLMDLEGTIKGLSPKDGTRATVDLRGNVDRYAPALIKGQLNLLSASAYSDMTLDFRNIELTSITPYSGYFAGYQIRKGKLSVALTYRIQDRKLDAGHRLVVDQLELGDKVDSPEATTLPVRLAVALLKDRHGVIDLNLPVTGSLDDPQFRLGPVIWKVFVNLIVKVATAPFSFIGSLFGGNDSSVNQIVFDPGSAALSAEDSQRLATLAKGLVERPALQLEVPAAHAAELDRPALQQAQLASRLQAVAAKAGADRKAQLLALWRAKAGAKAQAPEDDAALEAAVMADITVTDAELADLGRDRAAAIQDALLRGTGVEPSRVFVVNGAPASTEGQRLRIDLLMK